MIDPASLATLPLLADGDAAGTLLREAPDWRAPAVALNQARPQTVGTLHEAFAAAGARLLRTNTEGAHPLALIPHALEGRAEGLNNSGSALARRAVGPGGLVMGTLGPPPRPGLATEPAWKRGYEEQIVYLSDTGVEFLLLQHFGRLEDAAAVTHYAKGVSDAPVLAALRLDAAGRSADGHDAAAAGAALAAAGADALGLSCGPGPAALPACLEALRGSGLPLAVLAGIAGAEGALPYPGAPHLDPPAFAAWLAPLAAQGVTILGGCCGCTPAHTAALAAALA